jgi:hypothetical protein
MSLRAVRSPVPVAEFFLDVGVPPATGFQIDMSLVAYETAPQIDLPSHNNFNGLA